MSEELKLISLMRFRISPAVLGTSGRSIGFIRTITTSRSTRLKIEHVLSDNRPFFRKPECCSVAKTDQRSQRANFWRFNPINPDEVFRYTQHFYCRRSRLEEIISRTRE